MIGEIISYPGSSAPIGYLVCDGAAVSRADFSDLFSVIGTTYGSGDGSTTFNLPNLTGKVALGNDSTYVQGSSGGYNSVQLDSSSIPSHTHSVASHTHANAFSIKTPELEHSITTQPAFNYNMLSGSISKTYVSSSGVAVYNSRASAAMTRATDLAVAAHPATACTMSGGITDCPAFDTENAGGGQAHNNMMPYLSLLYCICFFEGEPTPSMLFFNGAMVATAGGGYIAGQL